MRWPLAFIRSPVAFRRRLRHDGAVVAGALHRRTELETLPGSLPLNTVGHDEDDLLRVVSRFGEDLHLAGQAGPEEAARPAIHPRRAPRDRHELRAYHGELLAVPQWSPSTVCGETWWQMASHRVEVAMLATGRRLMCPTCAEMTRRDRLTHPQGQA